MRKTAEVRSGVEFLQGGATGLDEQLCFALYAASNAMTRVYRPLLAELGLTYPQYLVLLVLLEERRCTAGHVARRLNLAPNAMTPLLDRLVEAGLIERARDPDDRRRLHLSLTDAARALEARIAEVQDEVACRTGLDMPDVAALRGTLQALARALAVPHPA